MKTRDRIIEQALTLFNEDGYAVVTTAALAAHCGIAEGNLWYHFKTKRALLEAIGNRFARAIEKRLEQRPEGDPVAAYVELMAVVMAEFRDYRFLYRDQYSFGELPDVLRLQVPQWLEGTFTQLEAHLAALVDARLLDWPREALHDLAINATIVLRYGLEHYRELGVPTRAGTGTVQRTLERHLTLFAHALAPQAARHLRAGLARIGTEALAA